MTHRSENPRPGLRIPLLFSLVTLAVYLLTPIGLALWTGTAAVPLSLWPAVLGQATGSTLRP